MGKDTRYGDRCNANGKSLEKKYESWLMSSYFVLTKRNIATSLFIQLQIGVAYNASNVSVYVVDLKRTQPFLGGNLSRCVDSSLNMGQTRADQIASSNIATGATDSASPEPHLITSSTVNPRGKPGQPLRKSFVKEKLGPNGQRPRFVFILCTFNFISHIM